MMVDHKEHTHMHAYIHMHSQSSDIIFAEVLYKLNTNHLSKKNNSSLGSVPKVNNERLWVQS